MRKHSIYRHTRPDPEGWETIGEVNPATGATDCPILPDDRVGDFVPQVVSDLQLMPTGEQFLATVAKLASEANGMTVEQRYSLNQLIARWERQPDQIVMGGFMIRDVLMVQYGTLYIGIEPDGYAHS